MSRFFAKEFNSIQGLIWQNRDLEVASSPQFSVVRDLDGKDEADEYDVVYKDLRNHEHDLVRGPMNDLICRGAIQKDRFVSD